MAEGDLGPWAGDDLEQTAAANPDAGADSELPTDVRFRASIAKLVRRRTPRADAAGDPTIPALFVLSPTPTAAARARDPGRVPTLDKGDERLYGRFWFVTENAAVGHFIDAPDADDDTLFRIACEELDAAELPAIYFDPKDAPLQLRYYPRGLGAPEDYEPIPIGVADVSWKAVSSVISGVHGNFLVTPQRNLGDWRLWLKPRLHWVTDAAEKHVQNYLIIGLQMAFPTTTIRYEDALITGRYDVEIDERDPASGSVVRHALLELKVLRTFGSGGAAHSDRQTSAHVRDGVVQARNYGTEQGARVAAVCCFDMRKPGGADCFRMLRAMAARLHVKLSQWPVFASAKEYREFLVAEALGDGA